MVPEAVLWPPHMCVQMHTHEHVCTHGKEQCCSLNELKTFSILNKALYQISL